MNTISQVFFRLYHRLGRKRRAVVLFTIMALIIFILILSIGSRIPTDSTGTPVKERGEYVSVLLAVLLGASIVSLVFNAIFLFRKRVIVADTRYLTPDYLRRLIKDINTEVKDSNKYLSVSMSQSTRDVKTINNNISEINDVLKTYLKLLDEKDREIKRFKNGYDTYLYQKFLSRFIRVDTMISDLRDDGEISINDLENVQDLMRDSLEECGVVTFSVPSGADYRKVRDVEDNPEIETTDDPNLDYQVKSTLRPGYKIVSSGNEQTIQKAKVIIYRNPQE